MTMREGNIRLELRETGSPLQRASKTFANS
jgi:hypothetical protein